MHSDWYRAGLRCNSIDLRRTHFKQYLENSVRRVLDVTNSTENCIFDGDIFGSGFFHLNQCFLKSVAQARVLFPEYCVFGWRSKNSKEVLNLNKKVGRKFTLVIPVTSPSSRKVELLETSESLVTAVETFLLLHFASNASDVGSSIHFYLEKFSEVSKY